MPKSFDSSVVSMPVADLLEDRLVRGQQAVEDDGDLLRAIGRALDRRQLGRVPRVADADPAQHLDPLGDRVGELELLLGVLVEQQVELVEGRARRVPVRLLVQRVEDRRVGEDLVEQLAALASRLGGQGDRQLAEGAEALELAAALAELRAPVTGCASSRSSSRSLAHGWSSLPWGLLVRGRAHRPRRRADRCDPILGCVTPRARPQRALPGIATG